MANIGDKEYLASRKEVEDHKNDKTNPHVYSVSGTLKANTTQIILSHASIKTSSTIDIYTSVYGVNPTSISVTNGSITLNFESQSTDMEVKVVFY